MRVLLLTVLVLGWAACSSGEGEQDLQTQDLMQDGFGTSDPQSMDIAPGDHTESNAVDIKSQDIVCIPDCDGHHCGPDGCGGQCQCLSWCDPLCTLQVPYEAPYLCWEGECMAECCPDCCGRECGDDGCAGICGVCQANDVCLQGECVAPCSLPTEWDPTGVVTSLETPADKDDIASVCHDFSGDGKGDNAFRGLASMINPQLAEAIEADELGILLEFNGVVTPADFTLVGLAGEPETDSGTGFLIETSAYDSTCLPLASFPHSSITNGELAAGPSLVTLDLAFMSDGELPLVISIGDARISGTSTTIDMDGVEVTDGVMTGIITRAMFEEALAALDEACEVLDPPDYCGYRTLIPNPWESLLDIDLDEDGIKDAASLCFQFTQGKATINGFKQER